MQATRQDVELEAVRATAEAVGRLAERRGLRRSPFHLTPCGGCGCPSFQQPCKLCGFYPMGSDKGTWSPREATFEQFEAMILRSGPGGADGTIATWHARASFDHLGLYGRDVHRERIAEAVAEAAGTDVADARTVWDVVSGRGIGVNRELPGRGTSIAWSGVDEIHRIGTGGYGDEIRPGLAQSVREAARKWIDAVHEDDAEAMREALDGILTAAKGLQGLTRVNGNLASAIRDVEAGQAAIEADAPTGPKR